MKTRLIYVGLLIWIFSPVAIPAESREASAPRWGIALKNNPEDSRKAASDESGTAPDTMTRVIEAHPTVGPPATSPSDSANPVTVPASKAPDHADDAATIEPAQGQSPVENSPPGRNPSTAAVKKNRVLPAIIWSDEKQKNRCNGYLAELRSLFLETRHFSIQGASCDTAVSAAAFLKSMEACERECPEGLLEHSGYSRRIIRNIRYLKKLGNDRCSGSLTPNPPMTKTP